MTQIWEACRADILNYIMIFLRSALVIGAIWGVCRWLRTVVQEEDGIKITILGTLLCMIEYVVMSGFLFLNIIFRLPSKYLVKGENIITFSGDTWKPNDFKEDDYRELGINIQRMTFKVRE